MYGINKIWQHIQQYYYKVSRSKKTYFVKIESQN